MLPRDFGQFKLIWSTVRQVQVENFTPSCNSTGHTLELKFQHGFIDLVRTSCTAPTLSRGAYVFLEGATG
ncbi:hypothetical protein Pcac1_g24243 [Phytophthora cactorum]|nr:hypothetical protein Pcac1_g24243 [Phytophthora cactorum]